MPERVATRSRSKPGKSGSVADVVIPDRLYFRIGDVAKLCKLPAYVLRFWETEFPQLAPKKSSTGQRLYRQRDVENVLRIKQLLYEEGFTIAGARAHLRTEIRSGGQQQTALFAGGADHKKELKQVRAGLQEILTLLTKRR